MPIYILKSIAHQTVLFVLCQVKFLNFFSVFLLKSPIEAGLEVSIVNIYRQCVQYVDPLE